MMLILSGRFPTLIMGVLCLVVSDTARCSPMLLGYVKRQTKATRHPVFVVQRTRRPWLLVQPIAGQFSNCLSNCQWNLVERALLEQ